MQIKFVYFLLIVIAIISCRQVKQNSTIRQVDNFTFIDSIAAAKTIVTDDTEHLFTKINSLDVSIQMKDASIVNRVDYIDLYKKYLQKEVSNFNQGELDFMTEVLKSAEAIIQKTNPNLLPKYKVAKIKTGHYGDGVYYTRANVIYVPANIFQNKKMEVQIPIMIHELWHILSEQKPTQREELYALIGFKKHNLSLEYPPQLDKLRLTNPDGANDDYAVFLPDGKLALPIILSDKNQFNTQKMAFMSYLKFDLFGIDKNGKIECDKAGQSLLTAAQHNAFFNIIKDNTQYIIHPDEIVADNFMLAMMANDKKDFAKFSSDGKKLINRVIDVTKK